MKLRRASSSRNCSVKANWEKIKTFVRPEESGTVQQRLPNSDGLPSEGAIAELGECLREASEFVRSKEDLFRRSGSNCSLDDFLPN